MQTEYLDYALMLATPAAPAWFVYVWGARCNVAGRTRRFRRALTAYGTSCMVAAGLGYALACHPLLQSTPVAASRVPAATAATWIGPELIGAAP